MAVLLACAIGLVVFQLNSEPPANDGITRIALVSEDGAPVVMLPGGTTETPVPTATFTETPTATPTFTPTSTFTPSPSATPVQPAFTAVIPTTNPFFTPFPVAPTPFPIFTRPAFPTPFATYTPWPTRTFAPTFTPRPSFTPRPTFTPWATLTPWATRTYTPIPSAVNLTAGTKAKSVVAGESATLEVVVQSKLGGTDTINLEIIPALLEGWSARILINGNDAGMATQVQLAAYSGTNIVVEITAPPGAASGDAGEVYLTGRALSSSNPPASLTLSATVGE